MLAKLFIIYQNKKHERDETERPEDGVSKGI